MNEFLLALPIKLSLYSKILEML